jgi:hypothetical protein
MCRPWKHELGKAQLPNTSEPLERRRLDKAPQCAFELIRPEFDQVVNGVSDPLWLRSGHEVLSSEALLIAGLKDGTAESTEPPSIVQQ